MVFMLIAIILILVGIGILLQGVIVYNYRAKKIIKELKNNRVEYEKIIKELLK